ncbi:hypothetical protein BD779DRAFT_1664507 [Infundibulicybe gibba]|nr:hypothetical protein BD779DRAFT_1664507 [Infundibulicybe gibba]
MMVRRKPKWTHHFPTAKSIAYYIVLYITRHGSLLSTKLISSDLLKQVETASPQQVLSPSNGGTKSAISSGRRNAQGPAEVITSSRAFMSSTAKLSESRPIRTLLDFFGAIPGSQKIQMATLTDNIAWPKNEKCIFLKHSLETRLVALSLEVQEWKPALALIDTLLTELKWLDDKMILTESYRGIGNFAKAKVSSPFLMSSRTAANSIYCPPVLQASLDLQSGILHAEDKDYTTAYSYFLEAFENMSTQGDDNAPGALQHMLLCKVILNLPEGDHNLTNFEKALRDYKDELLSDPTICSHLSVLYDTLLEQNLLRILEPYSIVELECVAETVGLSQMILDGVFHGVLDDMCGAAIETLEPVSKVVDSLHEKTVKIT